MKVRDKYVHQSLINHMGHGGFEQSTMDLMEVSDSRNRAIPGFFMPLGFPKVLGVDLICYNSFGIFALIATIELYGANILFDIVNADYIVVWGTNLVTNLLRFKFMSLYK